jgi:ADP-ribose pyrophosphatase
MAITPTSNQVLYDTKFLQLKQTQSPSGNPWVYAHRPNAKNVVVIAPIIHNEHGDSVVFLETRRPPIYAEGKAETCIELPAGLVGDEAKGETVSQAIKKELLEETGYKASRIRIVAPLVSSSAGCTSETSTIAIADIIKDKIFKKPVTDGGIIVDIHKVPLKKVEAWLKLQQKNGKAISAQALSALYFVMAKLAKVKGK